MMNTIRCYWYAGERRPGVEAFMQGPQTLEVLGSATTESVSLGQLFVPEVSEKRQFLLDLGILNKVVILCRASTRGLKVFLHLCR